MTAEEIQKLKDTITIAELAAKQAAEDAAASPGDAQKQAAKVDADAKLVLARKVLAEAELQGRDTSAEIQANKGRIVLLAAYLLAMIALTIYLLVGFFMA